MLTLQRASAGSGKTYTLTKQFIRLLISIPSDEQSAGSLRRLRSKPELADAVQRTLAVTFTNKATNEMKERILAKLNDLAYPADCGALLKADYISDFMKEFNASAEEISDVCKTALEQLLYNYSDFSISTIDSFFQTILRTFAYESDLPDSYQVVVGSDYLSRLAAKGMIDDFSEGRLEKADSAWLRDIVSEGVARGRNGWRIFQRKEVSGRAKAYDAFTSIIDMARDLEKEEFKEAREAIDNYFVESDTLRKNYERISRELRGVLEGAFRNVKEAARNVVVVYNGIGADPAVMDFYKSSRPLRFSDISYGSSLAPLLRRLLDPDAEPSDSFSLKPPGKSCFKNGSGKKALAPFEASAADAVNHLIEALGSLAELKAAPDQDFWSIASAGVPRIAIMRDMRRRISEYLADNDAMQLADTNTILRKIISDDDVPFIYERIGTRYNHYLIDEFQDTSRMQWQNFQPLLNESIGRGNDNLIIGDAKQSIYRFRNAEPELITRIVPESFDADTLRLTGYSDSENANWRSCDRIVKFNNFVFHSLAALLDEAHNLPGLPSLKDLYSNTIQLPKGLPNAGYAEVRYFEKDGEIPDSPLGTVADDSPIPPLILHHLSRLIPELLARGFRQRDIAILVNRKAAGESIIAALMQLNASLPVGMPPLKFVSEDSLRLENSQAVSTIIECFRLILGSYEASDSVKTPGFAHKFGHFLSLNAFPDIHTAFRNFMESGASGADNIASLMEDMQAVTLPSLTEVIIEHFVPSSLRSTDAPFLAAFQDSLLEYCETHPADIGSMLRWWERTGRDISISSPEGTEAINVMTIHKSKGLEFPCVILPDIDLDFNPKDEWAWIDTPQDISYSGLLPAKVPVLLNEKKAANTSSEAYLAEFNRLTYLAETDQLNKCYVATTRAEAELYILLPLPSSKKSLRFPTLLDEILSGAPEAIPSITNSPHIPGAHDIVRVEAPGGENKMSEGSPAGERRDGDDMDLSSGLLYRYGEKLKDVPSFLSLKHKDVKGRETRNIPDYYVFSDRAILKYRREGERSASAAEGELPEDPRSEGSLMHAVMENVILEDDLTNSLRRLKIKGVVSPASLDTMHRRLSDALKSVRERNWFDGSYEVLTERSLLSDAPGVRRPDRIMLDPSSGTAIIVDYKFGSSERCKQHQRQVRDYMELLLATGRCSSVEGYVWYVNENRIDKLPTLSSHLKK